MLSQNHLLLKCLYYLFMIMICFLQTSYGKQSPYCSPSACGHISDISYPFRLRDDPQHCGDPKYQLSCENNATTILYLGSQKYHVQAINYTDNTIRLADPTVKKNDTCSFPQHSLPYFHSGSTYQAVGTPIVFMSCPYPVSNSARFLGQYLVSNSAPFLETTKNCFNQLGNYARHTYILLGTSFEVSDVGINCSIDLMAMSSLPVKDEKNVSLSEIHSSLLYGFELRFLTSSRPSSRPSGQIHCSCQMECFCFFLDDMMGIMRSPTPLSLYIMRHMMSPPYCACYAKQDGCCNSRRLLFINICNWIFIILSCGAVWGVALHLALRILIGMPCMLGLLIYKLRRRRHSSVFDIIEGFLQSNNNLVPIRYSYSDIKKMTRGFREKLGQGGYGSVYKGKLRSGHDVAVKVLGKSKANGQDFINEVATIGRIHHVNVVKLVGYCAERSKRALVYDFMANGSLEKYIFNRERANSLSWQRKYEIAIGVARGIEYLHRGCNIQILHFDIKPHNILLDDNFTPKVSDFGLAKFYSTENNTVTLTAARGTIGYVAPELINRSIGGVSYKADVYSFGMLLMEMVGLKDMAVADDDESSKYFPYWIYDRFKKGKDIKIGDVDEDNGDDEYARKITRKMTIVGLWCIQMSPSDRPSMGEVLKMLEGDGENLEIPPEQPFLSPQTRENNAETWGIESTDSIALLGDDTPSDE